jgi:aspartyl-tRNA(Asn)/glutamyl-tRNA(Gln) amidotransferase subunit A
MSFDVRFASATDIAKAIRSKEVSAVRVTEDVLQSIKDVDPAIQSFVGISDQAIEAAHAADKALAKGQTLGPLHGVPIAVKDNYLTVDMPTHAGGDAGVFDFPRQDARAVTRLRAAGAVIVGKTRMHEFAWGNVTPPTKNPWCLSRVPGGSSGGSGAAVAAGLVPIALGSDTGGSIRIPASLCGTVGIKPTFGRVSRAGIVPHSWSLDHAGPLSRSVADSALVLDVLSGFDAADPATVRVANKGFSKALGQNIKGKRIAVCRNYFFDSNEAQVNDAVELAIDFFRRSGAIVTEEHIPLLEYSLGAIYAIELASSSAYHSENIRKGLVGRFTDDVRMLVEMGQLVSGTDYLKAEQYRRILGEELQKIFSSADAILTPTSPLTAWSIGTWNVSVTDQKQESVLAASWRLTYPWNLVGLPAISVPCGFNSLRLPIGLQLVGRPFEESIVLCLADAYEQAHDWISRRPEI